MLVISHLSKSFGQRQVLQDINLTIPQGQIYGLLGANGAGKTTLINLICGLLKSDCGQITIDGQRAETCARRLIGVVPQENLLYASLTCRENLAFLPPSTVCGEWSYAKVCNNALQPYNSAIVQIVLLIPSVEA